MWCVKMWLCAQELTEGGAVLLGGIGVELGDETGIAVCGLIDLVDANDPVGGGEGLSEVVELVVLVLLNQSAHYADDCPTDGVVAGFLVVASLYLPETVVAELVHEAVLHRVRHHIVHTVLRPHSLLYLSLAIVLALHDVRKDASADADHPEEFADVVAGVVGIAAEDDEDVVDVEHATDAVGLGLTTGHGASDSGDVGVVPSVVVHEDCAVREARDLVAIVPPRHDLRVLGRVLPQPVVRLPVVVYDLLPSAWLLHRQDHRRRRVCLRTGPRRVCQEVEAEGGEDGSADGG